MKGAAIVALGLHRTGPVVGVNVGVTPKVGVNVRVGVRLGVKTTGCSGLAYKLEYADEVAPEDLVFEGHGIKILIDPKSLPYLDGTELDFVREGLNEGFKFHNPREKDRCGCGESFRV